MKFLILVAIPRITPPAQERSAGVSPHEPIEFYNSGQHYNQYNLYTPHVQAPFVNHLPQIHHQMPTVIFSQIIQF